MLFIYLYRGDLYSDLWKVTCILDSLLISIGLPLFDEANKMKFLNIERA